MLRIFIGSWARTLKSAWLKLIAASSLICQKDCLTFLWYVCALGTDDSVQSCLEFLQKFSPPPFSNGLILPICQVKLKIMSLCAITRGRMEISLRSVLGNALESRNCIFKSSVKYISHVCFFFFPAVRKTNYAKILRCIVIHKLKEDVIKISVRSIWWKVFLGLSEFYGR